MPRNVEDKYSTLQCSGQFYTSTEHLGTQQSVTGNKRVRERMIGQSQKSRLSFALTAQKTVYNKVLEMAWQSCFAIITNSTQVHSKEGSGRKVFLCVNMLLGPCQVWESTHFNAPSQPCSIFTLFKNFILLLLTLALLHYWVVFL